MCYVVIRFILQHLNRLHHQFSIRCFRSLNGFADEVQQHFCLIDLLFRKGKIFSMVDFPAPFAPMIAVNLLFGTINETLFIALIAPWSIVRLSTIKLNCLLLNMPQPQPDRASRFQPHRMKLIRQSSIHISDHRLT